MRQNNQCPITFEYLYLGIDGLIGKLAYRNVTLGALY